MELGSGLRKGTAQEIETGVGDISTKLAELEKGIVNAQADVAM